MPGNSRATVAFSRFLTVARRIRQRARPRPRYEPLDYWERRSHELIDAYEHPETWAERGWSIDASPEERVVPELLHAAGARSVLVAGAGSGRQYRYLKNARLDEIRGFDLAPSMVAESVRMFPGIATIVDNVIGSDLRQRPADAVLAVTVIQHVRPEEIDAAFESLRRLASRLLIVMELTSYDGDSPYSFAHDYVALMSGWRLVRREEVKVRDWGRTELLAWERPA